MAVNLSPVFNDAQLDSNGNPASGFLLYTYEAGSSTEATTYQDSAGNTAHENPIELNSRGEPPAPIWLTSGQSYKFILKTAADVTVRTVDNVTGVNDTTVTVDQWAASGLTPTFVSTTQFTLSGDQTTNFHVGRRLKITDAGGTKYGYITASVFSTLTTVTVALDSGSLESPTSAVSYGIQTTNNPSEPLLQDTYPLRSGSSDKTKKLRIELDGITTATTRVWTAPDADLTVVGADTTQTLTNKTLTGATITGTTNTVGAGVLGTEQASTSGTSIDFTSIPSWVKKITIQFVGVSVSGTSNPIVQIGDSGGIETSGYLGAGAQLADSASVTAANYTTGFGVPSASATNVLHGTITLSLEDAAGFTWVASGMLGNSAVAACYSVAGSKSLSAALDRVRITTAGGSDTFDAGAINILYS